ncbi:hypothetical protein C8J57DRAFT_1247449 [Mycena rebaudengoi]|nr:hypothetical protein C8J57DRAFT_1247449 [Mycena rebaudengoi]
MKRRVKGHRTTRISAPLVVLLGYPAGRSPNIDMDRDPPFTVEVPDHSIANKSFGMRMWVVYGSRNVVSIGDSKFRNIDSKKSFRTGRHAPRCMWVCDKKMMMKRAHLRFDVVSGSRDFNNTIIFHEHELVGFHQRGIKFDSEYLNILFYLQEVSTPRRNTAERASPSTVNHPVQIFHFFSPLSI